LLPTAVRSPLGGAALTPCGLPSSGLSW
jgi:hypothetical protein